MRLSLRCIVHQACLPTCLMHQLGINRKSLISGMKLAVGMQACHTCLPRFMCA